MSSGCTCQECRRHPSREAYWWPSTSADGLPEMWLVTADAQELLATAPPGMYQAGQRVHVGVTR